MISHSTDIKGVRRSRQRGFFLNPFRFGPAAPDNTALFAATATARTAHALRVVVEGYSGPLVRVRRDMDNAELDIMALPDGELDVLSLLSFVNGGNGFIRTWYSQRPTTDLQLGAGNFSQEGTNGRHPRIVVSGVLQTQNSKPKIVFEMPQRMRVNDNGVFRSEDSMSVFMASDTIGFGRGADDAEGGWSVVCRPGFLQVIFGGNGISAPSVTGAVGTSFNATHAEIYNSSSGSQLRISLNGALLASVTDSNYQLRATVAPLMLGQVNTSYVGGSIAELILYKALPSPEAAAAIQANWAARFAL